MADICCGIVADNGENNPVVESSSSRAARRRRMEIRRFKFVAGVTDCNDYDRDSLTDSTKRQKTEISRECTNNCFVSDERVRDMISEDQDTDDKKFKPKDSVINTISIYEARPFSAKSVLNIETFNVIPKFGFASVCGRRRDMEDAVAVHPSFFKTENSVASEPSHYFAVYDGHGCSHVYTSALHLIYAYFNFELIIAVIY